MTYQIYFEENSFAHVLLFHVVENRGVSGKKVLIIVQNEKFDSGKAGYIYRVLVYWVNYLSFMLRCLAWWNWRNGRKKYLRCNAIFHSLSFAILLIRFILAQTHLLLCNSPRHKLCTLVQGVFINHICFYQWL